MDDESLIAAVAAGDDRALHALFTMHAPWLAARLRRTLPVDAVEDVVQETFIAVWRGAAAYKGDGALGAWLWGIARRQAALWTRAHGRSEIGRAAGMPRSSVDPAAVAATRVDLGEALNAVGPPGGEERELVRLRFIEDRPLADVACRLGIPEGTVKSRVFAVRRRLRAALRRGGD